MPANYFGEGDAIVNREEERKYRGDVSYGVWRSGGNPDRVDFDRVTECFYDHVDTDSAISRELRHQQPTPEPTTRAFAFQSDLPKSSSAIPRFE